MSNRPANDSAQDVSPALVAGQHAIDDQKRTGTNVVGDHVQRARTVVVDAERIRDRRNEVRKQVDLVIAVHALHDRRHALEAHAGVDRGLRQRCHLALRRAIELHKDEVPHLDVPIPVLVGGARRAAFDIGTVIVEDLAARTARPGIAHGPEIVFLPHARKALGIDLHFIEPDLGRFVVVVENGDPEFLGRQLERPGQELPRILNRLALEVVAKTEVAEHFEERVVSCRVTDILEIIVLAARAHAALRSNSAIVAALVVTEKHVLELHHAGIREQQGRVVARHERGAGNHLVITIVKKIQECLAKLVARKGLHRTDIRVKRLFSNPLVYGTWGSGLSVIRRLRQRLPEYDRAQIRDTAGIASDGLYP